MFKENEIIYKMSNNSKDLLGDIKLNIEDSQK